jgi:hypothetical protein
MPGPLSNLQASVIAGSVTMARQCPLNRYARGAAPPHRLPLLCAHLGKRRHAPVGVHIGVYLKPSLFTPRLTRTSAA